MSLLNANLSSYDFKTISCIKQSFRKTAMTATTPDKTVETFQYSFQFRAMVPSGPEETNLPPSPPLVQCCFGLTAQACISCVTASNIAIGEGGNSLLIFATVSIFVMASEKK